MDTCFYTLSSRQQWSKLDVACFSVLLYQYREEAFIILNSQHICMLAAPSLLRILWQQYQGVGRQAATLQGKKGKGVVVKILSLLL